MASVKKYFKDWLVWIAVISMLIIGVILIFYFIQIEGILCDKQTDWGEFGSLLGAITGLIAFVGVLFTLQQNKEHSLNSEERAVFFDLLKIFTSYRDTLRIKRVEWKYLNNECRWDIKQFDDLCQPENTFRQLDVELYHTFYLEIRRTIPKNFTHGEFSKKIIPQEMSQSEYIMSWGPIVEAIKNIYLEDEWATRKRGSITTIPIHLNIYDFITLNAIKLYIEQDNLKPIADACARAADHCFVLYKNQLGTYFRNAYYILEMVSEFNSPKNYSKIFRAQLSKYELVVLFFNSFGSQANPKTQELFLNADLFNNLELKDIRLKEGTNDESVSRLGHIIFPSDLFGTDSNEYMSRDFLKKLYKSVISK